VVYRASAGVDSIAQAAGRCNREGRRKSGEVYVFAPEAVVPAGYLRQSTQVGELVLRHHADPLSLEAVDEYFRTLYWSRGEYLDRERILFQLEEGAAKGNFPFRTIGEQFRLIEDVTKPIIVPYDRPAEELLQAVRSFDFPSSLARKLQRFTVQVYPRVSDSLVNAGAVEILHDRYPVLANTDLYRDDLGLCAEEPTFHSPENLIA